MINKFIIALLALAAAYASLALSTIFPQSNHLLHWYTITPFSSFLLWENFSSTPSGWLPSLNSPPKKIQGFMMGAWFFTLGIGGSISGVLGELADTEDSAKISITAEIHTYQHAFLIYMAIGLIIALVVMLLKQFTFRRLGKVMDL